MAENFFALYDALIDSVSDDSVLSEQQHGGGWVSAEADGKLGIAISFTEDSIAPMHPQGMIGLPLSTAAAAVKSWNYAEASRAMAAVNAALNTRERLLTLNCAEPYENHYTEGLDFAGKRVCFVGHMRGSDRLRREAKEIYTLERRPQPGDYPDAACEEIIPRCDFVIISGSTLVNKTLPRLLTLSANAYVILTGPTVPMCPALLDFGVSRLAGMAVTDIPGMKYGMENDLHQNPYCWGTSFQLSK